MVEDEVNLIQIVVPFHFFLKGREIPIAANLSIGFRAEGLPANEEELTDVATELMMDKLDSRSTHTLILEDDLHNKVLIERAEYQAMRVMVPMDYDPANYTEE
jgi:hypothetical protein